MEDEDDDDWGGSDEWNAEKAIDLTKEDMKNKNLNKLSESDLAAHKKAMDKVFNVNQLKPGDPGFVYDKVVEFSKADPGELDDDSWGEDDGVEEADEDDGG